MPREQGLGFSFLGMFEAGKESELRTLLSCRNGSRPLLNEQLRERQVQELRAHGQTVWAPCPAAVHLISSPPYLHTQFLEWRNCHCGGKMDLNAAGDRELERTGRSRPPL